MATEIGSATRIYRETACESIEAKAETKAEMERAINGAWPWFVYSISARIHIGPPRVGSSKGCPLAV